MYHNHVTLVKVLLGLMEGPASRGDFVIVGATIFFEAVDPALRLPGRFDREVRLVAPVLAERREILGIIPRRLSAPSCPSQIDHFASRAVGYEGADIRMVCS